MKQAIFSFALLFALFFGGCSNGKDDKTPNFAESAIQMKFIISSQERSGIAEHTIPYSGQNIFSLDETSGEIKLQDTPESSSIITVTLDYTDHIDFYLDDEFLFTAKVKPKGSSLALYNDVVLFIDRDLKKFYIKDGYPPLDESQKDSPAQLERDENWKKIKMGYQKFINRLRKEGRIK